MMDEDTDTMDEDTEQDEYYSSDSTSSRAAPLLLHAHTVGAIVHGLVLAIDAQRRPKLKIRAKSE
jgi:hypothetical protein